MKGHEDPKKEYMHSISLTLVLYGVGWLHHALVTLLQERDLVPTVQEVDEPKDWLGQVWKISPPISME
jgi:hypothetical protein